MKWKIFSKFDSIIREMPARRSMENPEECARGECTGNHGGCEPQNLNENEEFGRLSSLKQIRS